MLIRLILGLGRFRFYLGAWGYAIGLGFRNLLSTFKTKSKNSRVVIGIRIEKLNRSISRVLRNNIFVSKAIIFYSRLLRRLGSIKERFHRGHQQIKYRAAFDHFESLKRSSRRTEVLFYYERLMQKAILRPNELSGLIALALEDGKPDLCRKFIDAMLARYPCDYELHKGAAIRCFHFGDYNAAGEIWTRSEDNRAEDILAQGLDGYKLRVLGPHWFIVIGHIAHLDTYFKHQLLTGAKVDRYVAMVPQHLKIHNSYFLGLWRPFFIEEVPKLEPPLRLPQIIALTDEFWNIRFAPGDTYMFSRAGARVQQAWAKSGRPPLLSMPDADVQECWSAMEELGVPRGSWFVCLHVREPGFHGAWNKKHPATRDADIDSYDLAIEAVIRRGGYVIRIGDNTMKPVGDWPGFVDYAFSTLKSEMMDVFLCAYCRFFIGTNSGLSMVPPVFGKPCVLTNWSPLAIQNWFPGDLFIPKLIRSKTTGTYLGMEDMFSTPAGWQQFTRYFEENDLEVIDNSQEELREVVVEMMDRLDGSVEYSEEDKRRQAAFEKISIQYAGYLGSPIGRDFLKRYEKLLTCQGIFGPFIARERLPG